MKTLQNNLFLSTILTLAFFMVWKILFQVFYLFYKFGKKLNVASMKESIYCANSTGSKIQYTISFFKNTMFYRPYFFLIQFVCVCVYIILNSTFPVGPVFARIFTKISVSR